MRRIICSICAVILAAPAVLAQRGEVGGGAGGSFYTNNSVQGVGGTANAGHRPGFSAAGWIGHHASDRIGGEIRYMFQRNDLKVASGGTRVAFGGHSHAVHYDILVYSRTREDPVRPYVIVGGGVKGYFGTGTESAYQPLTNFAILTRTHHWQPLIAAGAGVKLAVGARGSLRVEFRDYITPFPKDVIAPGPGSKISGWVHNFAPLVGFSVTF
jgi:hypothetical protein